MFALLEQYFQGKTRVDQQSFERIASFFQPFELKRNEYLIRSGEVCRQLYFVNSGCLRFFSINREGHDFTRYFAFEEKFGTALSSFINQKPSFEFAQSVVKSQVLAINRDDFYKLCDEYPEVNKVYTDLLEMAYITSQERIYGLQGDTALERLQWLMAYQPKILSKLSNKVVASYLGITPYTLSRLKSEL